MKNRILLYFAGALIASLTLFCKNGNTSANNEAAPMGMGSGMRREGAANDTSKMSQISPVTDSLFGFKGCERAGFRTYPPNIREFKYQNFTVRLTPKEGTGEKIQVIIDSIGKSLDVPDVEPTFFNGAVRNNVLVRVDNGPNDQELIVYNLDRNTLAQNYRTRYCGELFIASSGTMWFYYPVEEKDVTKMPECPEREEWEKKGLHVGYGQRYMFNLPKRGLTKKSEFACIPLK